MIFLRLTADEAPAVLELFVRNGKNRLARQLKSLIANKLYDEERNQATNLSQAEEWFERQQMLINDLKENEDVSKN